MRTLLLLSLLALGPLDAFAQAAPPAQPRPTTPSQPQAQPARRAQPSRAGVALTVTDPRGATLPGVQVDVVGPTNRSGETDRSGQINFAGLAAGTYRLRFAGEQVITFEREVAIRAGQTADLDITLTPAPAPEEPPPPPPPPPAEAQAPAVGPAGEPRTLSIVDTLEKEFIGKEPRRESVLSCSGNLRSTMIQLNEPLPERLYDSADAVYYVLGGEGAITMDGRETRLATNGFVSVPRGTSHSFTRRGSRPLVLLAALGGAPCEEAR